MRRLMRWYAPQGDHSIERANWNAGDQRRRPTNNHKDMTLTTMQPGSRGPKKVIGSTRDLMAKAILEYGEMTSEELAKHLDISFHKVSDCARHARQAGMIVTRARGDGALSSHSLTEYGREWCGLVGVSRKPRHDHLLPESGDDQQIAHEPPQDPFSFATQLALIVKGAREVEAQKEREQEIFRRKSEKQKNANAEARRIREEKYFADFLAAVTSAPGGRTAQIATVVCRDKTTTREILRSMENAGLVVNVGTDNIPRWEAA